jgi:hypothetical protein
MLILGIIFAVIIIVAASIKTYLTFKENKAVQIAQEYLNQKYEQEMQYQNVRFPWIDPSLYHVRFSPVNNPEIIFEVLVQLDLSLTEKDNKHGNFIPDNYYVKYFEYCMEKYLVADVKHLWGDNATIKVLDVNIGSAAFSVSPKINDEMTLMEMEPLIDDYWIYIRTNDTLVEELLEPIANRILEFIQIVKDNGFEPETLNFWSDGSESEMDMLLKNWDEIDSVDQIIAQLRMEMER